MTKPTLEHRHYKLIASIIASIDDGALRTDRSIREQLARHFATELAHTNPRFSRERFVSAANGEPCNGRDKQR